jgi:hypothetical protein
MNAKTVQRADRTCFVVMPFGGIWDQYYSQIYEPAIAAAGLAAVRADDVFRAGSVLQDIVDLLLQSAVVLADISEGNRNVHYELGLAHALGKPTILVAPKGLPLFFDVGQERMLSYEKDDPFWGTQLGTTITQALVETLRSPETAIPTAFMHIKPSRVETDEVIVRLRRIEERLAEMAYSSQLVRRFESPLQEKILGLPAAEAEAARLVQVMSPTLAIEQLERAGFGRAMAEAAVATAASRLKREQRDGG